MKNKVFKPGEIYRWKKGKGLCPTGTEYDKYDKDYRFLKAADYNNCTLGDCWVINKEGKLHPGYDKSPIPIDIDDVVEV